MLCLKDHWNNWVHMTADFLKPQEDFLPLCISCLPVMICKELVHVTSLCSALCWEKLLLFSNINTGD